MSSTPPTASPPSRRPPSLMRRWGAALAAVLALMIGTIAICEWLGWPFLRRPMEQWLSQKLDRTVTFDGSGNTTWQLRVIGGLRLKTDSLMISGPAWSTQGPMLLAQDASLALRYGDLLALRRGEPLRVKSLKAGDLALKIERDVEGRASWQFGERSDTDTQVRERPSVDGIKFDLLEVRQGSAVVDDKIQDLSLVARFALRESWDRQGEQPLGAAPGAKGASGASAGRASGAGTGETRSLKASMPMASASAASSPGIAEPRNGVIAEAEGRYRKLSLRASLRTSSAIPWLSSDPDAPAVQVSLRGLLGNARLTFDGQVRDLLVSQGLSGRYSLSGPSLAAVGEPLGVTLPNTPPFALRGTLEREGPRWRTSIPSATIGKSKLNGDFEFYKAPYEKSRLSGELRGSELWLADLGPSIGLPADKDDRPSSKPTRVLPDRQFDLPSLRAMDADVSVKLARFESGSALLQAAEPLNGRIVLKDGVLQIRDIDARVARGQVAGSIQLDGRKPRALWEVRLRVGGVHLEQWLKMERRGDQPPYVTGLMSGRIALDGQGRSTAELLATADGRMVLYWTEGSLSHLLVEAAGIDVAQALGTFIRGDKALAVNCGVADLQVKEGRVTPKPMVIDTRDSLVRVDGDVSLATERLMLTAHVQPKDVSPLTLRTPVKVNGTMRDPDISLEKGPLLRKVVPAAVLGVALTPLAALLPLVDLGEEPDEQTQAALSRCNGALARTPQGRPGS